MNRILEVSIDPNNKPRVAGLVEDEDYFLAQTDPKQGGNFILLLGGQRPALYYGSKILKKQEFSFMNYQGRLIFHLQGSNAADGGQFEFYPNRPTMCKHKGWPLTLHHLFKNHSLA